ncbi:MAG: outer membrane beta-barrel protein [Alphaproteobacteria bacterium]|nr:outer membrane beta-barrel protein [Alphaproteobacteria bacterium]
MRKISVFALIAAMSVSAHAAPSHITRDGNRGYNVTYDYQDKAKTGWYVTARAELSFLNWKNKYKSGYVGVDAGANSDKYSFEPVFGGGVSFGKTVNYFWRLEGEAGYIGSFSDKDNGFEFKISTPYLMVNGYRDFVNGLYVGAGVGMAIPTTKLDGDIFISGDRSKTSVSPMGGLMLGWAHKLDDNFTVDVRYRLAGFNGPKQTRHFESVDAAGKIYNEYFENKVGFVLDNSISIGLRYEF